MYKYWKTAQMSATSYLSEGLLILLEYVLRFLRIVIVLSIWRIILAGQGTVSGLTLDTVLTYTFIGAVFHEQLVPRAGIAGAFWEGTFSTRFTRPLNVFAQFTAEMFGRWLVVFVLYAVPLLICAPLLGVNPAPHNVFAGIWFVPSLVLAITVGLAVDFIFGALMVMFSISPWEVERLRVAASTLLSGALIPLALLPWNLGEVFTWLPFAAMVSAPLRIYTGTGDPLYLSLLQLLWALVLWPLAMWMWRRNREKLVTYGG